MMWFRNARQTQTQVHDQAQAAQDRARGIRSAYRMTAAVQTLVQLMLWVTLYAYDRSAQTVWQAALMLLAPLTALWLLWRAGAPALGGKAARWVLLALVPCLMADTALVLRALCGYIGQLIPTFPYAVCLAVPAAVSFLAVLLARENGVAYGTFALRVIMGALFLLSTVCQTSNAHPARLWPILGMGLKETAVTALSGAGCVWGVALLYALPGQKPENSLLGDRPARALGWALLPLAMTLVWALWYGMVRPWLPGDTLVIGEKLMGLARHARSTLLYELTGLWWLLMLPAALTGGVSGGEKLLRAAVPKLPRSVCAAAMLVPAVVGASVWPTAWLGYLGYALPWRALVSLGAGVALAVIAKKEQTK